MTAVTDSGNLISVNETPASLATLAEVGTPQLTESTMPSTDRALAPIAKAAKMLAEAKTIDEILHVENLAQRAKDFAKAAGMGREAQNRAASIMLDARRKAGETLQVMQERGELAGRGRPKNSQADSFSVEDLGLTYSQSSRYQLEASVPDEEYQPWLASFVDSDQDLTATGLRKLANARKSREPLPPQPEPIDGTTTDLQELIDAGQKFGCIYADPPWRYGNQGTRASTDNHYETMTVAEICEEPVAELVAENAHLHLWTTNAFLFDAREVIEAWGFEYKSCLVWVKPQMGIGNYWRVSHEFLLFGLRGKAPFRAKDQSSWIQAERTKHSRKPYEVRKAVETVSPGPFLELYGREPVGGWMVYGNQIEPRLFS